MVLSIGLYIASYAIESVSITYVEAYNTFRLYIINLFEKFIKDYTQCHNFISYLYFQFLQRVLSIWE